MEKEEGIELFLVAKKIIGFPDEKRRLFLLNSMVVTCGIISVLISL